MGRGSSRIGPTPGRVNDDHGVVEKNRRWGRLTLPSSGPSLSPFSQTPLQVGRYRRAQRVVTALAEQRTVLAERGAPDGVGVLAVAGAVTRDVAVARHAEGRLGLAEAVALDRVRVL